MNINMTTIDINTFFLNFTLNQNSITYISIGCAYYHSEKDTHKYNQQFPFFLKEFHKKFPDIFINLILIDPEIETNGTIPFCITEFQQDKVSSHPNFTNIYYYENISIYIFKNYITYGNLSSGVIPNNNPSYNIMDDLQSMNYKCLNTFNNLLFVHDFTGYNIYNITTYFSVPIDPTKILYNITFENDAGCLPDLTISIHKPIIFKENLQLHIFNPCNIINYDNLKYLKILIENNSILSENKTIIIEQLKLFLSNKLKILEFFITSVFRRFMYAYDIVSEKYDIHLELIKSIANYDNPIMKKYNLLSFFNSYVYQSISLETLYNKLLEILLKELQYTLQIFYEYPHPIIDHIFSDLLQIIDTTIVINKKYHDITSVKNVVTSNFNHVLNTLNF